MATTKENINEVTSVEHTPESWARAEKYAKLIGAMPASFSTTIRTLRTNCIAGQGAPYDKMSKFMAIRLLKSKTLLAPVYFAACALHPDKLKSGQVIRESAILDILSPHELASILGVIYIYRRINRVAKEQVWESQLQEVNIQLSVGARLGIAIPNIGPSVGVMLGGLRGLSLGLFLAKDEKGFRAYRRSLNSSGELFNRTMEFTAWGCDHVQISAKLIQALGFGLPFSGGFCFGLTSTSQLELESDPEYYRWHIAEKWINSLRKTAKAPEITHKGSFYPLKAALDALCDDVKRLNSGDISIAWLTKDAEDLPEAMTRKGAASGTEGSTKQAAEDTEVIETELPPDLIEEISEEEDLDI